MPNSPASSVSMSQRGHARSGGQGWHVQSPVSLRPAANLRSEVLEESAFKNAIKVGSRIATGQTIAD